MNNFISLRNLRVKLHFSWSKDFFRVLSKRDRNLMKGNIFVFVRSGCSPLLFSFCVCVHAKMRRLKPKINWICSTLVVPWRTSSDCFLTLDNHHLGFEMSRKLWAHCKRQWARPSLKGTKRGLDGPGGLAWDVGPDEADRSMDFKIKTGPLKLPSLAQQRKDLTQCNERPIKSV